MNRNHFKKYAFTLVELIFVAMIIALIMPEMFSLYNFIIKSNREIIARQQAIQQGYEFFERLNILMEDYTIDYEEYYNRQMVGCVGAGSSLKYGTNFKRNVGLQGYCSNFTAYGNENNNLNGDYKKYNDIYYCSSQKEVGGSALVTKVVRKGSCGKLGGKQSYGQYSALFKDVKSGEGVIVGSEDDEELGYLFSNSSIDAIEDSDNIQELYLISHDGEKRLYFRRVLDKQEGKYKQYKIQMLRLRGFDAGRMHNFNILEAANGIKNEGIYDGIIDTWACDTSMGFEPKNKNNANCSNPNSEGNSVCGAYSEYYLPEDVDDCWVDLTHGSTDLFTWKIAISPRGDADLYRGVGNASGEGYGNDENNRIHKYQINSYMKIMIINKIYPPSVIGNSRRIASTINEFDVPLETTINMKDFYKANY